MADLQLIHRIFLNFDKRAERSSAEILAATFVDSAPLFDLLATRNNQVISGRRGTGKTHALKYLQKTVEANGDLAVYIDLRSIGSNGSIYGDNSRTLVERAGTLIKDVLSALLDSLYEISVSVIDHAKDPAQIAVRLDDFAAAISEVRVSGDVQTEETSTDERKSGLEASGKLKGWPVPSVELGGKGEHSTQAGKSQRISRAGAEVLHLNFGRVAGALASLIGVIGRPRIWLLIDEWSEVPLELQPYLADLIRRTILPESSVTLKIAAIEHRSRFATPKSKGEYIGLELGADVSADLNLDDFLVFENDQARAVDFFKNLLFKHFAAAEDRPAEIATADELVQTLFTQNSVFDEFVRAVEGVPRDALNLATKVVTRGWGQRIAMQHVRDAARDWYNQDKANLIKDNPELSELLYKVIDEVIGRRKARAFLFPANVRDEKIDALFDARVLHIMKKNTSSRDEPGARYDVYKIDYG